jgi:hypothetical protein
LTERGTKVKSLFKIGFITFSVAVALLFGFTVLRWFSQPSASAPRDTPNADDIASIKLIIQQYYTATGMAVRTFDRSQFPDVFVNDLTVILTTEQLTSLKKISPQTTEKTGKLDYIAAYYSYIQQGAVRLEQVEATAKAQGRKVTPADLQSNDGQPIGPPRRTDPLYAPNIGFDSFNVVGNHVEVTCDDGGVLELFVVTHTQVGWRIAGLRFLRIHL